VTNDRPSPLDALRQAVRTAGLEIEDNLLIEVLNLETNADPDAPAEARRARLRRLIEGAAGAGI
jgi:hypothetical protein